MKWCCWKGRVDVCWLQETQWKGGSGKSAQYKFLWQKRPEGIHGVGVLVSGVCG